LVVSDWRVEVIWTTGAATVSVVPVEMPLRLAVMVEDPALMPVARPDELIVAVVVVAEVHVTVAVMFWVLPSL
jgi:hypothetical protein